MKVPTAYLFCWDYPGGGLKNFHPVYIWRRCQNDPKAKNVGVGSIFFFKKDYLNFVVNWTSDYGQMSCFLKFSLMYYFGHIV